MKKLLLLISTIIILNQNILAQKNNQPGKIHTPNSIIDGFIKNCGESKIKYRIDFKTSQEEDYTRYSPKEISGFEINDNKKYISKQIELEGDSSYYFLEYLVDGINNLYFLRYKNEFHFYIENNNGETIELMNTESFFNKNGQIYVKQNYEYKNTLNSVFQTSPEIQNKIKNLKFYYTDLVNITKQYHEYKCPNQECIVYNKKDESHLILGITAGARFYDSNMDYKTNQKPFFMKKSPEIRFLLGKGNILGFNNMEEYIGVGYYYSYIENMYRTAIFNNFSIPVFIKFNKPMNWATPYLKVGMENTFHFGIKNELNDVEVTIINKSSKYQFWGTLGTGIDFKLLNHNIFMEGNLIIGKGINRTVFIQSYNLEYDRINLQILIGYKF